MYPCVFICGGLTWVLRDMFNIAEVATVFGGTHISRVGTIEKMHFDGVPEYGEGEFLDRFVASFGLLLRTCVNPCE